MMTMKELRIAKGLTQAECAKYLGISTRSYQSYENDPEKEKTAKYSVLLQKLEAFHSGPFPHLEDIRTAYYFTHVVTGSALLALTQSVRKYEKRDCFRSLSRFISSEPGSRIAILYGLRRTGKTTLLFQMINDLPLNQTAYVKIKIDDNMSRLTKDLDQLYRQGFRYIFIDEITLMDDFIGTAALLPDIFASMGMKIVVSGTNSLGFSMASRDELYDRCTMIHTSFIPFREYSRLLGIQSVDTYIEYGGTLKIENMSFDDPEHAFDEVSFRDDESTRKYIDSAISRNIQHSLKNNRFGQAFNQLYDLYNQGELTNVINRIVESMSHQFLLRIVQEEFRSHDLGSARELLLHEYPSDTAHVLYDVNEKAIVEQLKALIDIKEKAETTVPVTQDHVEKVRSYLFMLDLLTSCPECYETRRQTPHIMFTQPGMRYSIAKALIHSLLQDEYFNSRSENEKQHISNKILEDVKGRMMEDIVLLETSKALSQKQEVFRFQFDDSSEYDMVTYDPVLDQCRLYEVKHSTCVSERQTRWLRDSSRLEVMSHRYGSIAGRYVIYRGETRLVDDIQYLNVEEYLIQLGKNE